MKTIKCPICGTENRTELKYCRICFSRLHPARNVSRFLFKTSFYPRVAKHKNIFSLVFILLLLLLLWLMLK